MDDDRKRSPLQSSRRRFLVAAGGAVAGGGLIARTAPAAASVEPDPAPAQNKVEPFFGLHQGGIATKPTQIQTYFAAFDLQTEKVSDIVALLRQWTQLAARLTSGGAAAGQPASVLAYDSGETLDLPPARLTITFGFGPTLFEKDGKNRYGLKSKRPAALVDLPRFVGEQLIEGHTGGDLSIQACSDDQQVAFHAVRQLARAAYGLATIRWTQAGFFANSDGKTPRNLMGFKDGTINPPTGSPQAMDSFVWVGEEGPLWMRGGSYVVARRIRIALEHWDRMDLGFQEATIGRSKYSGAPLGGKNESDPLDLDAVDKDGNSVIPFSAHVRLAAPASNDGAQILRRGYSYNNGVNFTAERWPPWRQGIEYDAGVFFICYQRDPNSGFIKIFDRLSKLDAMNQFVTHVGSGIFACPPGAEPGGYLGEMLFG
ncbi:MAG: iron uptake transporter deferrochelatase/peroxidase subunit [Methylovirgula sp.]